jgi:hypothetical protein
LKGIPLFTYGMIGITTLVLAYITFTDVDIENPLDTVNPVSELQEVKKETIDTDINSGEPNSFQQPLGSEPNINDEAVENNDNAESMPISESTPLVEESPVQEVQKIDEPQKEKGGKKKKIVETKKRRTIRR